MLYSYYHILERDDKMQDKYNMTQEQNIFLAKRCVVDSIWKSSHIEGIEELTKYYETNNMDNLKQFIYNKCISGIVFPDETPATA